jgi:anti-sigma factor RsiW
MTCRKIRKALPLMAGGDLPARKERKLQAHLDGCAPCRRELEEYRSALNRVRAAARAEGAGEWSEAEWKALLASVTGTRPGKERAPLRIRPRWALAPGLAAVAVLAVLVVRFTNTGLKPEGAPPAAGPDVVSVTMVSQETGLKVVWFFNRNFDWKGDQK